MYAFSAPAPVSAWTFDARSRISSSHPRQRCRSARPRTPPTTRCSSDSLPRRQFGQLLAALAAGVAVSPAASVFAATEAPIALGQIEGDELFGYTFAAPASGWTRSTASLSSLRQATIFVCDEDGDSNINMVSTPVPGDFQKLTSFGSLENVLDTMVPRGRKDIEGNVISTRVDTGKNAYVIEYNITSNGIPRHLLTVFSLQPGRYVLTLTGQAREENWAAREPVIRAVVESFKLQKKE